MNVIYSVKVTERERYASILFALNNNESIAMIILVRLAEKFIYIPITILKGH